MHLAPFPRSTLRRRSLHFASPLLLPAIPSSPRPPTAPPPLPPHSTSISKSSAYESRAIEPCAMRRGLLRREMVTGEHTSTYRSTYRLHCCNQSRPRLTLFAALPSLFRCGLRCGCLQSRFSVECGEGKLSRLLPRSRPLSRYSCGPNFSSPSTQWHLRRNKGELTPTLLMPKGCANQETKTQVSV